MEDFDLLGQLKMLELRLEAAKRIYEQGDKNGRIGILMALNAVTHFLHEIPRFKSQNLAVPLAQVTSAIYDLDVGKQSPLLSPTPFGNRPPDSMSLQYLRAYAAWTLGRLEELGLQRSVAAKKIAKALAEAGLRFGHKNKGGAGTVISWWTRLSGHRGERHEQSQFDDLQGYALTFRDGRPSDDDQSKQILIQDYLDKLAYLVRSVGPSALK